MYKKKHLMFLFQNQDLKISNISYKIHNPFAYGFRITGIIPAIPDTSGPIATYLMLKYLQSLRIL